MGSFKLERLIVLGESSGFLPAQSCDCFKNAYKKEVGVDEVRFETAFT